MADFHYLDTCAVVGWCCAEASSVSPIDAACSVTVDSLMQSSTSTPAISELTLIELHDTLAKLWRSSDSPQFDEAWVATSMTKVMSAVESLALDVVEVPPKAAEHAMLLVTLATRDHGLKFKAWDATHLITAASWARSLDRQVTIVTADSDFKRFLDRHAHFKTFVDLRLISV